MRVVKPDERGVVFELQLFILASSDATPAEARL